MILLFFKLTTFLGHAQFYTKIAASLFVLFTCICLILCFKCSRAVYYAHACMHVHAVFIISFNNFQLKRLFHLNFYNYYWLSSAFFTLFCHLVDNFWKCPSKMSIIKNKERDNWHRWVEKGSTKMCYPNWKASFVFCLSLFW